MENAIIIFVHNSEKGKVKTKLSADIGEEKSLKVYKYLLDHVKDVTICCKCSLFVFYSHYLHIGDTFDDHMYSKHLQEGNDLSERMMNAFAKVFELGCKNVCIVKGDCYELQTETLDEVFEQLHKTQIVVGPSAGGGFYLIGMNKFYPDFLVENDWESSAFLNDTSKTITKHGLTFAQLPQLNNIDTMEDLLETDILPKLEEELQ